MPCHRAGRGRERGGEEAQSRRFGCLGLRFRGVEFEYGVCLVGALEGWGGRGVGLKRETPV